jgi:hypothetical protein
MLIAFCLFGFASSAAPPAQENAAANVEERVLENTVPKHLPIKVKIKKEKEKAFKDLKNDKWLRDFELEVTNVGDKPIYFLDFLVILPGITAPNGTNIAFPVRYGRIELGTLENRAEPNDLPIKPGETYVLKAYESNVRGWETFRRNHSKHQPEKLILYFQMLSFGDGTGFWTTGGVHLPEPLKGKNSLNGCEQEQNKGAPETSLLRRPVPGRQAATFSTNILPASLMLAIFLPIEFPKPFSSKPTSQSQLCCSGNNCMRAKFDFKYMCYNCPPISTVISAFCSDQAASCVITTENTFSCTVDTNPELEYLCTAYLTSPCGGPVPTPTPFPTPEPEPTATPKPTPCPLVCSESYPSIPADPCTHSFARRARLSSGLRARGQLL